jgi:FkbM family methyltransferase
MSKFDDLIELNDAGFYWPKSDAKGTAGTFGTLMIHADTPKRVAEVSSNKRVLVQAGGNCGLFIRQYASLFDKVYTFEPDPLNFYCLNLNVTEPNVHKIQAAVGFERKSVSIINEMTNHVGAAHVGGEGDIPMMRIDDLNLDVCDAIQLDIEGYEIFALLGAEQTIKRCQPIVVFESYWEHRYNYSVNEIHNFLYSLNYINCGPLQGTNDHWFKPNN